MTDILIFTGIIVQDNGLLRHAGRNSVILLRNHVIVAVIEAAAIVRLKRDACRHSGYRQSGQQHA